MTPTVTTTAGVVIAKNSAYVVAFLTGAAYLGLAPISIVVLITFIILDIIAGILKSSLLHGPQSIKSSILERGIVAKCLIIGIPLNIALAGKGISVDFSWFAQGTVTLLILAELYSIMGNFYAIRTGTERVEFDAVAYVAGGVRRFLKAWIIQD